MWLPNLLLISQVSAHLWCDNSIVHATVGGRFDVTCKYTANQYRFSKKYWCLGESRSTCEILMDTDGFTAASLRSRAQMVDALYSGLHVRVSALQLGDAGTYWVGIDKIYADIMVKIQISVREESVSVPEVWTAGPPLVTCRGQSITLHCRSAQGTSVQYSWYADARGADVLLRSGPELPLRCPSLPPDGRVVCAAHNAVSRERSTPVFLRVLKTGQEEDCVYTVTSEGLESYDCWITTQPPPTTSTTSEETSHPAARTLTNGDRNQTPHGNQTFNGNILLRSWSGVPVWYDVIRWCLFTAMIATIGLVHMYTAVTLR